MKKIPHFFLKPEKGSFSPSQTSSFIVSFVPKTLGKYSETLNLYLMNKNYRIPFTLKGASSTISDKIVKNRGPEGLPLDFEYTKRFIEESTKFNKKRKGDRLIIGTQESKNVNVFAIKDEDKEENGDKFEELVAQQYNKNKYNQFLKATRLSRIERVKTANIRTKVMEMTERKKALGIIEQNDDEEKEGLPPQDYEFLFGMYTTGTEPEKLPIPMNKDILFVKKPIDKYEPVMEIQSQCFNPDPNQRIKKKFPSSPKSHAEIRDCNQELTGSMLQKIYAGPIEINFGNMYIKSTETKTFSVRNDLRNSILVRILIENEELKGSYSAAQVIPSSQTAGFEITLCSKQLQQFKSLVKYIINEKHVFEFKVVAQIEPVKLDINQKTLEFSFADDNLDMEKSQPIRIYNKGNSSGRFRWIMTEQKIFTIRPAEGEVPAKSSIDVMVTYKPTGNVVGSRHEEEKLRMKVEDGNEELIKCYGIVKEMKCVCKQDVLDLGQIPVCKKSDNNYLTLKNVYKNIAVFQISLDKLPPYVEITPFKDKILPDETKSLKVSFFCKEEIKIDSEITILFRGGKSLVIPFKVETILPKVTILEEELNFGEVTTLGVSSNLMMTLMNHSNIPATLILDLRDKDDGPKEYEGIECVDIEPKKDGLEDSSIMVSLNNSLSEGASIFLLIFLIRYNISDISNIYT